MQTTLTPGREPETTINERDRKALRAAITICEHCRANVPQLKELGLNAAAAVRAVLRHFDGEPPKPAA